jgi:uncharacterized membrane protein (UPF0127 family)
MENIPPARVARRFGERLIGLSWSGRPRALALLIPRCRSVHTFGMRFPIDVVFLDRRGWRIAIRHGVKPGRVVSHRRAAAVLETKAGDADRHFVVVE